MEKCCGVLNPRKMCKGNETDFEQVNSVVCGALPFVREYLSTKTDSTFCHHCTAKIQQQ